MFNLSLTACSFFIRKTNSRGPNNIFALNSPINGEFDESKFHFSDAIELFTEFFKCYENMVDDNSRKQTFSCEYEPFFKDETDGFRLMYAKILSGSYGSSSDIVDPQTKQVKFTKAADDIDVRPFYVFVILPKDSPDVTVQKGMLIFQNVGPYGIKTITTEYMQSFFSSCFGISLNCRTIAPDLFVKKVIRKDNTKKLVMVRNITSADTTDRTSLGYGKEMRIVGNLCFTDEQWPAFFNTVKWVAGGRRNLFEFEHICYDTLKIIVDIGGRTRTIDLHNLENLSIIEAIPDEIRMPDGHPDREMLAEYFKKVAAEYLEEMVLQVK